jgi:hypothetical protein
VAEFLRSIHGGRERAEKMGVGRVSSHHPWGGRETGRNGHLPRSPRGAIHWENRVSAPHLLGRRRKVQKPLIWIVRYAPENRGEQAPLVHWIGSATPGKTGEQYPLKADPSEGKG